MMCLGLEPRVAGWKAQKNPLSYSGTPIHSTVNYGKILVHYFSNSVLLHIFEPEFSPTLRRVHTKRITRRNTP